MMERERPQKRKKQQQQRLEAWLGQPVRLEFISESSTEYVVGVLDEVNERGIVLSADLHTGHPAQALFYPWSTVVQLSEAQGR